MSFLKTNVDGIPLTQDFLTEFCKLPQMPGERVLRPKRIMFLLGKLRSGKFVGAEWHVAIDRETEIKYRVDGHHSSVMLSTLPSDVPFPTGLLMSLTTYECDSLGEDGADIFNLFNNPESVRNNDDAMEMYRARVTEVSAIESRLLGKIAMGIIEYNKEMANKGSKSAVVYKSRNSGLYWENPTMVQFACWAAAFNETKNAAFLARSPIVTEMFVDWQSNTDHATEFWELVFKESHPEPDHHTRELADTFKSWLSEKKHKQNDYRKKAATAWKHFLRENRGSDPEPPTIFTPQSAEGPADQPSL